jgi:hypothetical protein
VFSTKYKSSFLLVIYCLISVSCAYFSAHGRAYKKAQSANKRGHYEKAVYASVDALLIKPDYEEVEKIIDEAFPKAIHEHHKKIDRLKSHQKDFYWDKILNELKILKNLKLSLEDLDHKNSQIWLSKADVRDYISEIDIAKNNAAEDHYQKGLSLKSNTDRESQKNAAQQFQVAQSFVNNYKDAQDFYLICKNAGTTRIAILPFSNKSGKSRYGSVGENISSSIRSALLNDQAIMEFVNIIDRQQIDQIIKEQKLSQSGLVDSKTSLEIGKLLGVHQIISGEVTYLTASKPEHLKNTQRYTKEVVIDTEAYTDDEGKQKSRNIYGEVGATVTTHSISASAQIRASYQVLHAETAQVLNSEMVSGSRQFNFTWATYNGDQRALSNEVKKLTRKSEKAAPSKEQLVLDAITNLNEKIIRKVKKVYK